MSTHFQTAVRSNVSHTNRRNATEMLEDPAENTAIDPSLRRRADDLC